MVGRGFAQGHNGGVNVKGPYSTLDVWGNMDIECQAYLDDLLRG
jgi:hypothetical protein